MRFQLKIGGPGWSDDLTKCAEADAHEFYGMRIPELGDRFMARSREIIREAAPDFVRRSA